MKLLIALFAAIGAVADGMFVWGRYHKKAEAAFNEGPRRSRPLARLCP